MIANGLFISKLIYMMPVWGGCERYLINVLQVQQNTAARLVTGLGKRTPIKELLKQCGWMSVNQLIFYHTVVLLHKIMQVKAPGNLYEMIDQNFPYNTRQKSDGKLKVRASYNPHLTLNTRSFRWRAVMCWNELPPSITRILDTVKFKKQLKTWVLDNVTVGA